MDLFIVAGTGAVVGVAVPAVAAAREETVDPTPETEPLRAAARPAVAAAMVVLGREDAEEGDDGEEVAREGLFGDPGDLVEVVGVAVAFTATGAVALLVATAGAAGEGAATTVGVAVVDLAAGVLPILASSSILRISVARWEGLRVGASTVRSASPGLQPLRSFDCGSAPAEVSSHVMSSFAPA